MVFQAQLKKLLNENDVTVAQLARATSISAKTIHHWLEGHEPGDISKVKKVASYFKVTMDFLCFGEADKSSPILEYEDEINAGVFEVILRKVKR